MGEHEYRLFDIVLKIVASAGVIGFGLQYRSEQRHRQALALREVSMPLFHKCSSSLPRKPAKRPR